MYASPSPLLSARQIERRLRVLACSECSAPGPHRVPRPVEGGYLALCEPCRDLREAQVAEDVAQEIADVLEVAAHGATLVDSATAA